MSWDSFQVLYAKRSGWFSTSGKSKLLGYSGGGKTLGLPPECLLERVWDEAQDFALLTSSQMMPMLLPGTIH
jgi:hypothetical protein